MIERHTHGKAKIFNVSLAYTLKIAFGRNSAVIRIKIAEISVCIRILLHPQVPNNYLTHKVTIYY